MKTRRYDAIAAAQLMDVSPATVRSWVHRQHLPTGRYEGGRLTWTAAQLKSAKQSVDRLYVVADKPNMDAICSCGATARISYGPAELTVTCPSCHTAITMERKHSPRGTGNLDLTETTIDPEEVQRGGANFRIKALGAFLKTYVCGPQVYFIRMGPYVKIGTSTNIGKRLISLSLKPGHLVATLDGGRDTEKELHQRFAHHQAFGEWFYLRDDLLQFVIDRQREQIRQITEHIRVGLT